MRPIRRGEEPSVLKECADAWRDEYLAARASGDSAKVAATSRWGHQEIRSQLATDASRKCAYCEAVVADVSYPHVEHIRPKSKFPELAHDWSNLGVACQVCNVEKGDYWDDSCSLLDPYGEDVYECLVPVGGIVFPRLGHVRADVTIRKVDLNRAELARSRVKRLEKVQDLLERWAAAVEPQKSLLAAAIGIDVEEGEFTASTRNLLRAQQFPLE